MMTIDDAIKHEEERAADLESTCTLWKSLSDTKGLALPSDYEFCKSDAEDHRQVAAWLKELKALKEESKGDLISREALKAEVALTFGDKTHITESVCELIDKAPTAEELEKPFITECRDAAIEQNLPLYFVYYEEAGILEVYVTETKELFEKRRCSKHLPDYKFKEVAINYLDWYSDWKGGAE